MEVKMKKIFLALAILNVEANCMERWGAYFNVVHNGIGQLVVAKVAPGNNDVKLLGHEFEEKNQLNLAEEEDALEVVVSNINSGTIGIYSSENLESSLLNFVVRKTAKHAPATVDLTNVGAGMMAVLYRPSMGGGDNFVLALGHSESDVSASTVRQSQRLGRIQTYFPIKSIVGPTQ
jgi:hypothetical protein